MMVFTAKQTHSLHAFSIAVAETVYCSRITLVSFSSCNGIIVYGLSRCSLLHHALQIAHEGVSKWPQRRQVLAGDDSREAGCADGYYFMRRVNQWVDHHDIVYALKHSPHGEKPSRPIIQHDEGVLVRCDGGRRKHVRFVSPRTATGLGSRVGTEMGKGCAVKCAAPVWMQ
jgi:hypothetical protein